MANTPKDQNELTEEEIERRRDKIARRMLETPPRPHKEDVRKKPKPKRLKRRKAQRDEREA